MADQLTSSGTWAADLLYELREDLQEAYPTMYPLLAMLQRDTSRKNFTGSKVRVPIFSAPLNGAQGLAEGGTLTNPQIDDTSHAEILMAHLALPVSISPELLEQSADNAAVQGLASKAKRANESLARTTNELLNGAGDGLLGTITDSATSLTVTLATGAGNIAALARQLWPKRIVDVRTRSNGNDPGQGLKRKITSVTKNADGSVNTVTFDTNPFGGGSGNIVHTSAEGIYIVDTYGNAVQGFQQIGGTSGTFQNINRATAGNDFWKGTDGRNGVTTAGDPTQSLIDAGFLYLGERSDLTRVDAIVGDPGVNLKLGQLFYSAQRMNLPVTKIEAGFQGVEYRGIPIIDDFDHQLYAMTGITKSDIQMYAYKGAPDWDRMTGGMFQRFSRTKVVEAWWCDDLQLGAKDCRSTVRWQNLNRAS